MERDQGRDFKLGYPAWRLDKRFYDEVSSTDEVKEDVEWIKSSMQRMVLLDTPSDARDPLNTCERYHVVITTSGNVGTAPRNPPRKIITMVMLLILN